MNRMLRRRLVTGSPDSIRGTVGDGREPSAASARRARNTPRDTPSTPAPTTRPSSIERAMANLLSLRGVDEPLHRHAFAGQRLHEFDEVGLLLGVEAERHH